MIKKSIESKNLEEKILKNVYKFEKQRTTLVIARYIILFVGVGTLIALVIVRIIAVLNRQGDIDLLQLFGEDRSIIAQYFGEVADTFIIEFPKFLAFELGTLVLIFAGVVVVIVKNFGKIKNRINSLKKHQK